MLYELCEYTERLRNSSPGKMVTDGFERRKFLFLIHIDKDGNFLELLDMRKQENQKEETESVGKEFEVPRSLSRTSDAYKKCNFLWDHTYFVLGVSEKNEENDNIKRYHTTWLNFLNNLPADLKQEFGIKAMLKFYEKKQIDKLKQDPNWEDFIKKRSYTMFWLKGESSPVPCRAKVKEYYVQKLLLEDITVSVVDDDSDSLPQEGFCCVTGQRGIIEKTHSDTPITSNESSNAPKKFISFQEKSGYDSYGKTQGYNAPIIRSTSRRFTDAINHLVKDSQQHVNLGESVVLFWAAKNEEFIKLLKEEIEGSFDVEKIIAQYDDPTENTEQVKESLLSAFSGAYQKYVNDDSLFYVLILAPGGGSRICVKYWNKLPISKIAQNIVYHLQDVSLYPPPWRDWKPLPLKAFLAASTKPIKNGNDNTAEKNSKIIKYNKNSYEVTTDMCSDLLKAVLENYEYPKRLLQQTVLRCKMDSFRKRQNDDSKDSKQRNFPNFYEQVSIIKACINRSLQKGRPLQGITEKLEMSLDKANKDQSYLLGRLFAVLERIQWLAHKKEPEEKHSSKEGSDNSNATSKEESSNEESLNSTLRERFYASASTTPAVVFPTLFCLKEHHFAKLRKDKKKRRMYFHLDNMIGEIMDKLGSSFPNFLTLEQQGVFAIGYYHQKYQPKKQSITGNPVN